MRQDVEVGPIWNNDDANTKAHNWVQNNPGWRYTGEWRTTKEGVMSTITVEQMPLVTPPIVAVVGAPMMQPMMGAPMMQQMQPMMTPSPMVAPPPSVYLREPMNITCPFCSNQVTTVTKSECSCKQWLVCCVLCWVFWPVACVPFCIGDCYNISHLCPSCGQVAGKNDA